MSALCAQRPAGVVKGFGRRPGTEAEARAEGPASESLRGRKPRAAEMATARGLGYGDLRAGRSVERGSRPAWSAWSGMFEAICEGGSREEAHATDRRKTVLAAADDGGVSGNMPPRPLGES